MSEPLNGVDRQTISRRELLRALGVTAAAGVPFAHILGGTRTFAQGRCMLTLGAPSCNTSDITPVFAPTGWKTVGTRPHHLRRRRLSERSGVLHRAHGMDAAERRRPAGCPRCRKLGLGDFQTEHPGRGSARDRCGTRRCEPRRGRVLLVRDRTVEREDRRSRAAQARPESGAHERRQGLRGFPREGSGWIRSGNRQRKRLRSRATERANGQTVVSASLRLDGMEDRVARSLFVFGDELQGERVLLHESPRLGADVRRRQPERVAHRRRRQHHRPRR